MFAALAALAVLASFVVRASGDDAAAAEQSPLMVASTHEAAAREALPAAPQGGLQPTAATTERRPPQPAAVETADLARFDEATRSNARLSRDLRWAFGGKQQRGWYLYAPLIARLIEHDDEDFEAHGFAASLARWQQGAGLAATGVLDSATLSRMVAHWQSVRLKERGYPTPDQLVTVPASEFFDPSRPDELRQVEREAYAAYKRMVAEACADPSLGLKLSPDGRLADDEKFLKIVSSFRSREYQERLRRQSPHSGRAGLAVNSPHFTGRALDIYVGGEPVTTKDENRAIQVETPVYKWLVRNAERFGFRPYYYEPWHWEYVGTTQAN